MADRTDNPTRTNLLGIPETLLGEDFVDVEVSAELADGDPREVATRHPDSPLAWATLAQEALEDDDVVSAYAFARTGYHRGLDALRRAGWRGAGPIPADHVPNQGFLMALLALADAAEKIGEDEEAQRCRSLADDSDPAARDL